MKYLSFIILLISLNSISQTKRIYLYGELYDKVDAVVNAHIINLTTKQGTYSNENGEFRIYAKANDSLQISSVGYKTKILHVKVTDFGIAKNRIELLKENYTLDEVEVGKNNLIGSIYSDSKLVKDKKLINAETLKLPFAGSKKLTPAERRLHTARGGGFKLSTIVSLDLIINSISGRIKKLKKLKELETTENRTKQIESRFALHIEKDFKILKSDIHRFISYCTSDEEFNRVYYAGEIDMIQFLKKKADEFKKLNPKNY
ncbi:hypothetical protein WH52_01955 [Tenacibaculum holothuriorum]|uniref:Carboxypeptidase-like regulatory domain-containing protein n=1 Tax=Tenacibaculum holothuriorum TaxID=1635173 RepID=A0A1Y2PG10_9FLAO|nr:carboxypeptidase-like regulatory domain-containing protein [Tenacibaculum holothuriorum]OSY89422.1 hypothetical protein WH52_01955 [Tenacibaculum holothuriorum]